MNTLLQINAHTLLTILVFLGALYSTIVVIGLIVIEPLFGIFSAFTQLMVTKEEKTWWQKHRVTVGYIVAALVLWIIFFTQISFN